ncbi:MAG: exodeoxyribonuclease VII large subunit [Gemmatimonadales bacterium]
MKPVNYSFDLGGTGGRRPTRAPDIPGTTRESAVSIRDLNDRTKDMVERSFGQIWVRGEVSDFKRHRTGHWYFSLRDSAAQMACVVWSGDQWRIPAPPDEGMQVVALAQMAFYAAKGTLQLRITRIEASGDGLWRKAMEQTIARLTADGLMAPDRKRPLPKYPRCVGVVTSTGGAALRDIISVAHRRRPGIRVVVAGTTVQGEGAPGDICAAIERIMRWGYADVLIVGRGGGSREDLWAFNDERVARAVAACRVPVISAVGHEIDVTVCDLVADVRAATPSVAAENAIPALADMFDVLVAQRRRLGNSIQRRGESARVDLRTAARDMRLASLRAVDVRRVHMAATAGRLNALSPLATLSRGYAVARTAAGETLGSTSLFEPGDKFNLLLRDGTVAAIVDTVLPDR